MLKRKIKNLCLQCYGELDFKRVCKNCGKEDDKSPSPPHHLAKRTLLNKKYVIIRSIGEGGFGITYLAYDLVFSRPIAIKEYYPSGYVSRAPRTNDVIINARENSIQFNRGLRRFIDEAKHLSTINKLDGIVSVLDFFPSNSTAYLVMEFLDGVSLKRYIQKKGKLDTDTALTILHPVISSLGAVHDTGLIHRDISPDNILITRNSEVKLIDFGASQDFNDTTKSTSIVLKQGFAPEEQYRTHGVQGPWSDIYALAVTIYFCITGQLPPESIQRLYEDTIKPPSALGSDIKPAQEKALMKALAVLAKDRYKNVRDFERDIYSHASRKANTEKKLKLEEDKNLVQKAKPTLERIPGANPTQSERKTISYQRASLSESLDRKGRVDSIRTKREVSNKIRKLERLTNPNEQNVLEDSEEDTRKNSLLDQLFYVED